MEQLILSILFSFLICIVLGPLVIPLLHKLKFGQNVRDDGPKKHLAKAGTPTMGGVITIFAVSLVTLLMGKGSQEFSIVTVLVMVGYGLIGFLDDFIKVKMKRSLGLRAYQKIIGQFGLALVIAIWAYRNPMVGPVVNVPFLNIEWDLGWFYIPFAVFVIIAIVNSVNLTDGLDGLASGVMMIDAVIYGVICAILTAAAAEAGNVMLAANLNNEMIFAGALAGGCLGFLRFNAYPARVFMGDTGSLALGGALSMLAISTRSMLIVPIIGIMFMMSSISVILLVGSYKLRNKKRVFLMAPLHHHFELKGFPETKIVSMYMIITAVAGLVVLLNYV